MLPSPLADTNVPPSLSQAKPPALATKPNESYPPGTCTFREKLFRIQQEFSFTSPLEKTKALCVCGKYRTLTVVKPTLVQKFSGLKVMHWLSSFFYKEEKFGPLEKGIKND